MSLGIGVTSIPKRQGDAPSVPALIGLNTVAVRIGDSITQGPGLRSPAYWENFHLGGRIYHGPAWMQGVASRRADELISQGVVVRAIASVQGATDPYVEIMAGRNDLAANETDTQIITDLQAIIDMVRTAIPTAYIGVSRILASTAEGGTVQNPSTQTLRRIAVNAWIDSLNAYRVFPVVSDTGWSTPSMTLNGADGTHPDHTGGYTVGLSQSTSLSPRLASGDILAVWDSNGWNTAASLISLATAGGTITGATGGTGTVASGWSVSNTLGVTMVCLHVAANVADDLGVTRSYPRQIIKVSGTPTATGNIRMARNLTGYNPTQGSFHETLARADFSRATTAGAPVGLFGYSAGLSSCNTGGGGYAAANRSILAPSAFGGVIRALPYACISPQTSVQMSLDISLEINTNCDIRVEWSQLKVGPAVRELTAYAAPFETYAALTNNLGTTNSGGTSHGSTVSCSSSNFGGGGLSYTYQWARFTNAPTPVFVEYITPAPSPTARTYTVQGTVGSVPGLDTGYKLGCYQTATNILGSVTSSISTYVGLNNVGIL